MNTLDENGMAEFNFIIEEDTNGEAISSWEVEDFEEAGVSDASSQLRLYLLFSHLKPSKSSNFVTPYVVQFLESEPSLKKYAEIIRELEINGDVLLKSKTPFLRKIGIGSVLDASKMIVLFRKFTGDDYNHEKSQQYLISAIEGTDIKGKPEYIQIVKDNRLSFCMLKEGGVDLLEELGITKQKSRLLIKKLRIN